jgi:hypothetical protein
MAARGCCWLAGVGLGGHCGSSNCVEHKPGVVEPVGTAVICLFCVRVRVPTLGTLGLVPQLPHNLPCTQSGWHVGSTGCCRWAGEPVVPCLLLRRPTRAADCSTSGIAPMLHAAGQYTSGGAVVCGVPVCVRFRGTCLLTPMVVTWWGLADMTQGQRPVFVHCICLPAASGDS